MRIVFILPVVSQARYQKRCQGLKALGIIPKILAFERNYYTGKPWPQGYQSLGQIQHKRYAQRLTALIRAIFLVKKHAQEADVFYCFSLDTLALAWFSSVIAGKNIKLAYEVGDVREFLTSHSIAGKALRWLEYFLVQKSAVVVVTSPAYLYDYYHGIQQLRQTSYIIIENKLLTDIRSPRPTPSGGDRVITIGYFGVIRCRNSWQTLKELTRQGQGKFVVYIRGILMELDDLADEITQTEHVYFEGSYTSPDDLPHMYNQVDLVWVAHLHGKNNTKMARANRFYEACNFQRPMIAQIGSQDGNDVARYQIGMNIDLALKDQAVKHLLKISYRDLKAWQHNITMVPLNVYQYTDEHKRLVALLSERSESR